MLFWDRKCRQAKEKLTEQFGITWSPYNNEQYKVSWNTDSPFVLILNQFGVDSTGAKHVLKKAWFLFSKGKWTCTAVITREQNIELYWEIKGAGSLKWSGKDVRNDYSLSQTESIVRMNDLEQYFLPSFFRGLPKPSPEEKAFFENLNSQPPAMREPAFEIQDTAAILSEYFN